MANTASKMEPIIIEDCKRVDGNLVLTLRIQESDIDMSKDSLIEALKKLLKKDKKG